ncbi:GNAT family N-acetyltransferase [Ewingella sp. S1.OA.A_B6]
MAWGNESKIVEWARDGVVLSTDRARLDIDKVHHFLCVQSLWARGQPRETLLRSIDNSVALGLYCQDQQIGFARVVTDFSRLAYLMDIFIDEAYRGRGLGTWLSEVVRSHPDLINISKWMLTTSDAQAVYQRAGWNLVACPQNVMEITRLNPASPASARFTETVITVKESIR